MSNKFDQLARVTTLTYTVQTTDYILLQTAERKDALVQCSTFATLNSGVVKIHLSKWMARMNTCITK